MCLSEFVVEFCVYYGCVPWDRSPHPRAVDLSKRVFPSMCKSACRRARDRSGYAAQLAYLIALMRRMTR